MYSQQVRDLVGTLLAKGNTVSAVSRQTGVNRATIRAWRAHPVARAQASDEQCPLCGEADLDGPAYAALLGFCLGDGCICRAARFFVLRVSCDASWPGIINDVESLLQRVRPGMKVFRVRGPGVIVVQAHWKHWPCLFPQHGPGRKHERPIVLEEWQRHVVEAHPGPLLRGLFHSDGCRVRNWTRRLVGGEMKRYDYPRWQFTNHSADIRELCCWALDRVGVPWRQSTWKTISLQA